MKTYINEIIQKIVDAGITVPDQNREIIIHSSLTEIWFEIEYSQNKKDNILKNLNQKFKDEFFRLHFRTLPMVLNNERLHATKEFIFCTMRSNDITSITITIKNQTVSEIIF